MLFWNKYQSVPVTYLVRILIFSFIVILDADSTTCQKATFNIGPSTSTSRSWEIKVTQYGCGNEDRAGIHRTAENARSKIFWDFAPWVQMFAVSYKTFMALQLNWKTFSTTCDQLVIACIKFFRLVQKTWTKKDKEKSRQALNSSSIKKSTIFIQSI